MLNLVHRINRFLHHLCLRSQDGLRLQLLQRSIDSQSVLSLAANGDTGVIPSKQAPWKACEGDNMDEFILWNAKDRTAFKSSAVDNNTTIRQNNLAIPIALNNQTVEDVWKGIQKQSTTDADEHDQHYPQRQRQFQLQHAHQNPATFGEMSLEDFVVTDDPNTVPQAADSSNFYPLASGASIPNSFSNAVDAFPSLPQEWINLRHYPFQHQQLLQQSEAVAAAKRSFQPPSLLLASGSPIYEGPADNAALGPDNFANTLALPTTFSDYSLINRKRCSSEAGSERVMERRQKRMIKNRESAARSRARKQAYTVKLETEITALKEENARLRKQWVLQMLQTPPESTYMEISNLQVPKRTQSI